MGTFRVSVWWGTVSRSAICTSAGRSSQVIQIGQSMDTLDLRNQPGVSCDDAALCFQFVDVFTQFPELGPGYNLGNNNGLHTRVDAGLQVSCGLSQSLIDTYQCCRAVLRHNISGIGNRLPGFIF